MENFANYTRIIDLKVGTRNVNIRAIILEIECLKVQKTQEDFYRLVIADKSAKISCVLYDKRASYLKSGDIVYMTNCYMKLFKSEFTIYKSPNGNLIKIDEFCMVFNDASIKQKVPDVRDGDQDLVRQEHFIPRNENIKRIVNENKNVAFTTSNRYRNKLPSSLESSGKTSLIRKLALSKRKC